MARGANKSADLNRLDGEAWTVAALDALRDRGIDGVRVESLATVLKVTKGSFYWHFKDRDALYESMLSYWRRRATLALIARFGGGGATPEEQLRQLLRLPIVGRRSAWGADVELEIRLWGRRDPRAQAALEEVDQLRLKHIAQLLQQIGIATKMAEARAILAYSYMRVAASLIPSSDADMMAQCERLLLGPEDPSGS